VAITRAKRQLFLTHHSFDSKGKTIKPLELAFFKDEIGKIESRPLSIGEPDPAWNTELVKPTHSLHELLANTLESYKLNATAVNSFVNLEYAGPQAFLLNNLLRFPSAKSASAEFGSAIHETLKLAHQHYSSHKEKMPIAEAKNLFIEDLTSRHLMSTDHEFYLGKGQRLLETYLNWADFNANQVVERKLTVKLRDMTLTGNLDLLQVDKKAKTISVFDYKTGSPFEKFDSGTKFKTHGYKQQLMFYKLLIENTPEFADYTVEKGILHFVEPVDGKIETLELYYSEAELAEFIKLIEVIWKKIQNLDFPSTIDYEKNLRGTLEFERSLLNE
jgi:DNA helicase-2/ATP-dependent DNA helicase PcrA